MQLEISESALGLATTSTPLSETDKTILRELSCFNTQWVPVCDVLQACRTLNQSLETLLLWLRQQSVNKITQIGTRHLAGFPVVKTWMYDPNNGSVFLTFSPYLFDSLIDRDA